MRRGDGGYSSCGDLLTSRTSRAVAIEYFQYSNGFHAELPFAKILAPVQKIFSESSVTVVGVGLRDMGGEGSVLPTWLWLISSIVFDP